MYVQLCFVSLRPLLTLFNGAFSTPYFIASNLEDGNELRRLWKETLVSEESYKQSAFGPKIVIYRRANRSFTATFSDVRMRVCECPAR
jgi:hypothetical protein